MLEYDRIDITEANDTHKTNASEECNIFHYWHFKSIGFKYEPYLGNGCHGLMRKLLVSMMLLLFILKEVLTEFTFGI